MLAVKPSDKIIIFLKDNASERYISGIEHYDILTYLNTTINIFIFL